MIHIYYNYSYYRYSKIS